MNSFVNVIVRSTRGEGWIFVDWRNQVDRGLYRDLGGEYCIYFQCVVVFDLCKKKDGINFCYFFSDILKI